MVSRRYLTLDHWRGAACLAVLVNHSVWSRTGTATEQVIWDVAQRLWMGVPVFFVISGYCIAAAVHSHMARANRPLHEYFTRRLRRIYPPYWVVLMATLFIVAALDVGITGSPMSKSGEFLRPWWYDTRQWLGNLTLTETWRSHILPGQKALMLGHVWTLCYEEQFYVVAGLLLWLLPRHFFVGTIGVTAATAAVVMAAPAARVEGFFFDGSWFQFWFGVLVFQALGRGAGARLGALCVFLLVAAGMLVQWPLLLVPDKNNVQALFVASLFAALLVLLHSRDAALARVRWLRPVQWCGVMCYSLYLVHLPVVKVLRAGLTTIGQHPTPYISMLLAMPMCLAIAWGFHVVVERHFLNPPTAVPVIPSAVPMDIRTA